MTATAVDIVAATTSLLKQAQVASSGRAGRTLHSEAHAPLKQTLLALRALQTLADHTAPGAASVMVVHGSVMLHTNDGALRLNNGDWASIPRTTHSLQATDDAVVLLTVAVSTDVP